MGKTHTELKHISQILSAKKCKVLRANRRIRIWNQNQWLADTDQAIWVWEHDRYPAYWLPSECFVFEHSADDGQGLRRIRCNVGDAAEANSIPVVTHQFEPSDLEHSRSYTRILFDSVDQWFEEDEPIFVHPKDPFKRIDVLPSTRSLTISLDGVTIAETRFSLHLHETGLPVRYYIPRTCVDHKVLVKSSTKSQCPYKGEASYHTVRLKKGDTITEHRDIVWFYPQASREVQPIAGMLCFYNEKVDIKLDGTSLERPVTHFS